MESFKTAQDKRLEKQLAELQSRLSSDVSPFRDNSPAARLKRYGEADASVDGFGRRYTPHYFDLPPAGFHYHLDAMAAWQRKHLFVVHAPREHGKSTRMMIIKLRALLLGHRHFWLKVSETLDLAQRDLAFVLMELKNNTRINADFDIRYIKTDSDKLWLRITPRATGKTHVCALEAYSYGTPMRGTRFMRYRPDACDIDDFENARSARNKKISGEKLNWVLTELYLAVTGRAPIIWLGNNLAKTGAMNQAFTRACKNFKKEADSDRRIIGPPEPPQKWKRHTITGHRYQAVTARGKKRAALWKEQMSLKALDALKKTIGTANFSSEMQGAPINQGLRVKDEWFIRYDALPKLKRAVLYIDQSLGQTKNNDFKALIAAGTDGPNYYVLGAWVRQASLKAMVDAAYTLYETLAPLGLSVVFIEDNFGQYTQVSYRDFLDGARRHGYPLPIRPIQNTVKKELRIESAITLMEIKRVLWPAKMDNDLEETREQLLGYPDHAFDDAPDALSGALNELRWESIAHGGLYKSMARHRYAKKARG